MMADEPANAMPEADECDAKVFRGFCSYNTRLARAFRVAVLESDAFRAGFEAGRRGLVSRSTDAGAQPETMSAEAGLATPLDIADAAMLSDLNDMIARNDDNIANLHRRLDEMQARLRRPLAI
jgi:hypothetical protein